MTTYEIKCRNNKDAVDMGHGRVRIPGAESIEHLGRKDVRIESSDPEATKAWLDGSFLVVSYEAK